MAIVNVAEVAPTGTVTEAGTVTEGSLDVKPMTVPPATDTDPRVTVPTELTPPTTCGGASAIEVRVAGVTVRPPVTVFPRVALIVAFTVAATGWVVAVMVAEVAPAGIVTDPGTVTVAELLLKLIDTPPAGAAVPKVTVPVEVFPPGTEPGEKAIEATPNTLMAAVTFAVP